VFPQRFGKYLLLDRIGAGGMAEVFRATTEGVGGFRKELAIKRILERNASDDEFVKMFIDEAKITVSLRHPNIAEVYELGCIEGAYFIALEYVDGHNLADVLRAAQANAEPMPRPLCVHIAREVAQGLYAAHGATDASGQPLGIIHRDVSPQNVLLGFQSGVKLIDFGVAKARSKLVQTSAGTIRGKLLYMSPEQARAQPMDGRSDLFSLGLLLYKLLVGHNPFEAPTEQEVLERLKRGYIAPIRSVDAAIEPALAAEVHRCLQRRPEDRHPDAHALYQALGDVLQAVAPGFSPRELSDYLGSLYGRDGRRSLATPHADGRGPSKTDPDATAPNLQGPLVQRPASGAEATESLPRPAVELERMRASLADGQDVGAAPLPPPPPNLSGEATELLAPAEGGAGLRPGRAAHGSQRTLPLRTLTGQTDRLAGRPRWLALAIGAATAGLVLLVGGLGLSWLLSRRAGEPAPTAGVAGAVADAGVRPDRPEDGRVGGLRVRTRPSGAAVFVDGAPAGRTPVDLHDLPSGRPLRVLLLLSDHVAHTERVVVRPGSPGVLFVRMRPTGRAAVPH